MTLVVPMPAKLGKYEVRREVGRGGMGIVYEGYDPVIDRRVALKTFLHEFFDSTQSDNLLTRLRREAQAAGRLSHPNIIAVYDFGEDSIVNSAGSSVTTPFIAMEFVEGRSLESFLDAHERFALPQIVRIMSELLDALEYSHQHGVVHRDIKPANIILLKDGVVKVADFGVARIESSTLTQAGTVLGSPGYMSPEQFMAQTVDGRSDLYSAGVVLYELLTGEVAFTGAYTTIMHRVLNETPSPPSALNVQVPRSYDAVLTRAMAKRPAERYQTAAEFKQAIVAALRPANTTDSTVVRRAEPPAAAVASPPSGGAKQPAAWSTARLAATAAGLLLVMVALAAAYRWRSAGPQPAAAAGSPAAGSPTGTNSAASANTTVAANSPTDAVSTGRAPAPGRSLSAALVSAAGMAVSTDSAVAADAAAAQKAVSQDARRQAVAKAAALYIQPASLSANDAVVRAKLFSRSDEFIVQVVQEPAAQLTPNGVWIGTLRAKLDLREVQKSLNQISRDERVTFIRNHGNPRIAVTIATRDADAPDGIPATPSPVAENILKEHLQSFGFIVVDAENAQPAADFRVEGEIHFKRLAARLPASGLVIEKYALTAWTLKALDVKTGGEIYHDTALPEHQSWPSVELAMRDIGQVVGSRFTKDLFLQYFEFEPQRARLRISGLPPDSNAAMLLAMNRSLVVLNATADSAAGDALIIDADISGAVENSASLVVDRGILTPLNRRMGAACFKIADSPAAATADSNATAELDVIFDASCSAHGLLEHLADTQT